MGRPIRLEFEHAVYHVMSRGNAKMDIFVAPDDRGRFIELIEDMSQKFAVIVYAYVLMDNHYHLLIETVRPNLSKAMHYLNSMYARYFNRRHKRVGHFFQSRYLAVLVDKDAYLLEVSRYIHLNPVRAGIAQRPEQFPWSSYREYTGKGIRPWIRTGFIIEQFSGKKERAKQLYKQFVEEALDSTENPLRKAIDGILLGGEAFIASIRERLSDSDDDARLHQISEQAIPFEDVVSAVSRTLKVPEQQILQPGQRNNMPRKICLYLLKELTDLSHREIGVRFSIKENGVSKGITRIKEAMERNPGLKKQILEIKSQLARHLS